MDEELDAATIKLMCELQRDGRKSFVELAKSIGVSSHSTAKKKLTTLEERGLFRIRGETNAKKMDFTIILLLLSTFSEEDHSYIIESYKKCPRVIRVGSTIGEFDIFVIAYGATKKPLESIIHGQCFGDEGIRIRNRMVLMLGDDMRPEFFPILFPVVTDSIKAPCDATCYDCKYLLNQSCEGCPALTDPYKTE
ncbi:MAG: Lrp/AsnC family transcriptional regulator [Candidatus Heimdallarchaeota archaeon]|nr:Lrp/AsnC family transcriptional regulator [Candidatus Heimdallarchaeota archaeon]MCK5049275.1 Lrp/AsnC family transcriptional regulator [Candidatus Heimdallarchaeota archaeon]